MTNQTDEHQTNLVRASSYLLVLLGVIFWFLSTNRTVAQTAGPSEAQIEYTQILSSFGQSHDTTVEQQALKQLMVKYPAFPKPRFNLAMLAAVEQKWADAIRLMTEYHDLSASPQREKADKIIDSFKAAQNIAFSKAMQVAQDYIKGKQYERAEGQLKQAQNIDPSRWEATATLGILETDAHHYNAAIKYLKQSAAQAPSTRQNGIDGALSTLLAANASSFISSKDYLDAGQSFLEAWNYQPSQETLGLASASSFAMAHDHQATQKVIDRLKDSTDPEIKSRALALQSDLAGSH